MYIRKTTTKKSSSGIPYTSYRIVSTERVGSKVKQRTILNIGSNFELEMDSWPKLCKRIEDILSGQQPLIYPEKHIEAYAQNFASRIISDRSSYEQNNKCEEKYEEININSIEMTAPRSVGVESAALDSVKTIGLDKIIQDTGMSEFQSKIAIAGIVGRMAYPGSESATWNWLCKQSALGELLGIDFNQTSLMSLYRASDKLIENKCKIENELFSNISSIFSIETTITLYDLTNTYFEGVMRNNDDAKRGFSKEKRFDCPLLTLALVLDGSGFIKRSKVFKGNISESSTIKNMLNDLDAPSGSLVVMDRGIATKENINWLASANYHYIVVSRERSRTFDISEADTIYTSKNQEIKIYKEVNDDENEAKLYCYSSKRSEKEKAIANRFMLKFEEGLCKLDKGLSKPHSNKSVDYIWKRIGRLLEKCHGAGRHYKIQVIDNKETKSSDEPLLATRILYEKKPIDGSQVTHPGVYCIRTNALWLDAEKLWKTYIMLTELEAVFRSMKSELGLRPVYHHTPKRCEGHLFITVLAYQCVHAIRFKLKMHGINKSWDTLRTIMSRQQRVTARFRQRNGSTLHIRKSTQIEPEQREIYDALGLDANPGGIRRYTEAENM